MKRILQKTACLATVVWAISLAAAPLGASSVSSTETSGSASLEMLDDLKPESAPSFPLVRMVLTLALLLGALYLARPLLKKIKGVTGIATGDLNVVGRVSLGPRAGVCLVQAEGRRFLVGVGNEGVRLLAELGPMGPLNSSSSEGR